MFHNALDSLYFLSMLTLGVSTFVAPIVIIPKMTADPLVNERGPTSGIGYSVSDFMVLFAMLGVGMTGATVLLKDYEFYKIAYVVVFMSLAGGIWWTSVVSLSRAGIKSQLHRTLILGLATPGVWLGSFGTVFGAIASVQSRGHFVFIGAAVSSVLMLLISHRYIVWVYRIHGVVTTYVVRHGPHFDCTS
jgi:hypothetical protein